MGNLVECPKCRITWPEKSIKKHTSKCKGKVPKGDQLCQLNFRRRRVGLPEIGKDSPAPTLSRQEVTTMDRIVNQIIDSKEEIVLHFCPCCGADILKIRKMLLGKNGR